MILSNSGIKQWIWYYKEYLRKFISMVISRRDWWHVWFDAWQSINKGLDNICYNTMMVVSLKTLCLDYSCTTQYKDTPVIVKVPSSSPQTNSLEETHQQFKNYKDNFKWKILATLICWDISLAISKEAVTNGVPVPTT